MTEPASITAKTNAGRAADRRRKLADQSESGELDGLFVCWIKDGEAKLDWFYGDVSQVYMALGIAQRLLMESDLTEN